jgi:PAS domain S-box-containing protein
MMEGANSERVAWLAGGGEMGALMRRLDWTKTPLGAPATWSPTLRMMTSFVLANRFPLLLWWGPEYISIYNDAYRPILGRKHPRSMGQPVEECWSEIWHILKPLIDTPFSGGPATWMEDLLLEINRYGFVEETHFTIAYSPVPDDTAPRGIGGVLATVHEITDKIIGERRVAVLRDIGTGATQRSAEAACAAVAASLANHAKDVPFALLYLVDADRRQARLKGAVGIPMGLPVSPLAIDLAGNVAAAAWLLGETIRAGAVVTVENLASRFDEIPRGPWSDPPNSAVVVPIQSSKADEVAALLVAGVSPRLRLDHLYRSFFDLLATQIATAIANARAYEEERRRAEALAQIDRAKTAFFSNVSHEFRTPLTLMINPIEELLALPADRMASAERQLLSIAHRNSLRLLRLVNALLDFSRVEAGRMQASYEAIDLAAFTIDLASSFRSACARAGLAIEIDCPTLDEPVYVDREMWEKIVLNLLSNAFKFTLQGRIEVMLRSDRWKARLTVSDTGIGIPAAELPRIFERFYRVEGQDGRTHEGTGIGLALVQELVRLHGGEIGVESARGQGTRFTVAIPLGRAHIAAARIGARRMRASTATGASAFVEEALRWLPPENAAEPATAAIMDHGGARPMVPAAETEKARILVADDNADMRDYLCRVLSRWDVQAVGDGQAGLEAIRRRKPDLVVADIMMPALDGIELLSAMRRDPELLDVPVILLSARAGEEARVEGLGAGADDYLVKPFLARELIARVESNLALVRLRSASAARLRASEERLRLALGAARMGTWEWDAETGLVTADAVHQSLFGLPPQVQPQPSQVYWAQMDPDEIAEGLKTARAALQKGADFEMEQRVIRLGGEIAWMHSRGRAKHDAPTRMIGVSFDVTDRKRAEEALRRSEARLQAAIDLVGLSPYSWHPATDALHWDSRLKAMWGLRADAKVDAEIFLSAIHPDDRARVEAAIASCADPFGDGVYDVEYRVIGIDDGVERWVSAHGQTFFEKGQPVGHIGAALDITERKRSEQRHRESEARLGAILEQIPVGVALFDREGRLRQSNTMLRRFVDGDTLPSMNPRSVSRRRSFHPDGSMLAPAEYPAERALRGETVAPGIDFLHTDESGRELWARVGAAPFRDEHGEIIGVVSVTQDIDAEKRAAQTNLLLIAELQHRTRNLLAVVDSLATETIASSPSLTEFAATFRSRLATLSRVQGLLSRGDDVVTMGELVGLELHALGAEPDGRRIVVSGPEVALPKGSVQILALAVHELATNARKHGALGPSHGTLQVSWTVAGAGEERRLLLEWRESGAPPRQESGQPARRGFGWSLIEEALPFQLDAQARLELGPEGLRCRLSIPLPAKREHEAGRD